MEDLGVKMTVQVERMQDLPEVEVTEDDVTNARATCRFVLDRQLSPLDFKPMVGRGGAQ